MPVTILHQLAPVYSTGAENIRKAREIQVLHGAASSYFFAY